MSQFALSHLQLLHTLAELIVKEVTQITVQENIITITEEVHISIKIPMEMAYLNVLTIPTMIKKKRN